MAAHFLKTTTLMSSYLFYCRSCLYLVAWFCCANVQNPSWIALWSSKGKDDNSKIKQKKKEKEAVIPWQYLGWATCCAFQTAWAFPFPGVLLLTTFQYVLGTVVGATMRNRVTGSGRLWPPEQSGGTRAKSKQTGEVITKDDKSGKRWVYF